MGRIAICIVLGVISACGGALLADSQVEVKDLGSPVYQRSVVRDPDVTDEFYKVVLQAVDAIPSEFWERIRGRGGIRIIAVNHIPRATHGEQNTRSMGSVSHSSGRFRRATGEIFIAQRYVPRGTETSREVEDESVFDAVFHELGHAFDYEFGPRQLRSANPALRSAYDRDRAAPGFSPPVALNYFLKDAETHADAFRPEELFAEGFAIQLRTRAERLSESIPSASSDRDQEFKKHLPSVLAWVGEQMDTAVEVLPSVAGKPKQSALKGKSPAGQEVDMSSTAPSRAGELVSCICTEACDCLASVAGLAPPEMILRMDVDIKAQDASWRLSSRNRPPHWTTIRLSPLIVEVNCGEPEVEFVELLINGRPWNEYAKELRGRYVFKLPCPGLGRHVLQARYLSGGRWSRLSAPLRFDVQPPPRPAIIAVADGVGPPVPVSPAGLISIRSHFLVIRLAHIQPSDRVFAYLDGRPIGCRPIGKGCCFQVMLTGHAEPGVHSLSVRSMSGSEACVITSQQSAAVTVHYFCHDAYVSMDNSLPSLSPYDFHVGCLCDDAKPVGPEKQQNSDGAGQEALPPTTPGNDTQDSAETVNSWGRYFVLDDSDHQESDEDGGDEGDPSASNSDVVDPTTEAVPADHSVELARLNAQVDIARAHAELAGANAAIEVARAQLAAATAQSADAEKIQKALATARAAQEIAKETEKIAKETKIVADNMAKDMKKLRIKLASAAREASEAKEATRVLARSSANWAELLRTGWQSLLGDPSDLDPGPNAASEPANLKEFSFLSSAHFPLREFGQRGEVLDREGAVIYEGMKVSIAEDGRVRLSGHISTPDVPVTLHLRLLVKLMPEFGGHVYTITFPAIDIAPEARRGRRNRGVQKLETLTEHLELPQIEVLGTYRESIQAMRREGTARLGYGFEAMRQNSTY